MNILRSAKDFNSKAKHYCFERGCLTILKHAKQDLFKIAFNIYFKRRNEIKRPNNLSNAISSF